MRTIVRVAGLATLLSLAASSAFAAAPPAPKSSHGTLVIVFKDGHRQSFNLGPATLHGRPALITWESGRSAMDRGTAFTSRWRRMAMPGARSVTYTAGGIT